MENNILEPNKHFDFTKLSLAQPVGIQGGAYFTKFLYKDQPFYIEAPKCLTKQGFIKHGKRIYTELMFDNSDSHFIHWIENLESTCHKLIYENSDAWFKDKMELNDIESAFTSSLRIFKSGKYYLLRVYGKVNTLTSNPNVKIYNENETLLSVDDIKPETNIISIIELQGIKFTNKSFQIEYEIKQIMVITIDKIFEQCVIKKHKGTANNQDQISEQIQPYNNETDDKKDALKLYINELSQQKLNKPVIGESSVVDTSINSKLDEHIAEVAVAVTEVALADVSLADVSLAEYNPVINTTDAVTPPLLKQKEPINEIIDKKQEYTKEYIEEKEDKDQESLEEFDINDKLNSLETITLKKPNEVYYKIYKEALQKAKNIKRDAINAILEAKNIKNLYMLDSDSDDSEVDSDFDENETIDLEDLDN